MLKSSRTVCLAAVRAAKLYGIVDLSYVEPADVSTRARELIAGGAGVIQLRAKGFDKEIIQQLSQEVLLVCRELRTPFIVNDYADIAAEIGSDGLHIGQDDGSLVEARNIVGSEMIIGRSTHSVEQARAAMVEGFDYGGFGPLFPTPTKKGRPGIGLDNILTVEAEISPTMPLFCIGGITPHNLQQVISAGATRMVIVSALLTAQDTQTATSKVLQDLS